MLSNQPPMYPATGKNPNGIQPLGATLDEVIAEINTEIGLLNVGDAVDLQPAPIPDADAVVRKQFIRFMLNKTLVLIPLNSAIEIGRLQDWRPMPNLPSWVLGIANIRGEIVSMIDMKGFFGMSGQRAKHGSPYLILRSNEMSVGVIVDQIRGIFSVDPDEEKLQGNPYRNMEISEFISGVYVLGEDILHVMNVDKLLKSPKMDAFHKV